MREIQKSNRMQGVRYDVRGKALDESEKLMAQGIDVLQLNIGNPARFGFSASEELLRNFAHSAADTQAYSSSKGVPAVREAIVKHCVKKGIVGVTPDDVYTGNGVSEMITTCMQALVNHGDEILLPAPDYPLWTAATVLNGGKAVHYLCDESSGWYPDIQDIRRKVTSRTRAIVVINPNNPTGALYPREVLQQIVDVAREHDLVILADEIYENLVMDGKEHVSIASLAPDRLVISMSGLSKSHIICGYRVGWMVLCGDKSSAGGFIEGLNMLTSMRLCSNVPAQSIIPYALEHQQDIEPELRPGGRLYEQRECIYNAINSVPGLSSTKPEAAFYMFPKVDAKRFNIHDDEQFVVDFLREQHVLVINGTGFNWPEPDHFRIVYLPRVEQLQSVAGKMGAFLQHYRQA